VQVLRKITSALTKNQPAKSGLVFCFPLSF
jgi:hypothetical protein